MKKSYLLFTSLGITVPILLSIGCCDDSDNNCPVSHDENNDGHSDCHEYSFWGSILGDGYRDCPDSHDKDNDGDCDCRENDPEYIMRQAYYNERMAYSGNCTSSVKSRKHSKKKELDSIRKKAFLFNRKRIRVGFSHDDLLKKDVNTVYSILQDQAFTNISVIPVYDIGPKSRKKSGKIKEIYIGDTNSFLSSAKFPYDISIKIYYHEKKEIIIPFSAKNLLGCNYMEVHDQLTSLGFSNIQLIPKKRLFHGLILPIGTIRYISINGNDSFKKNTTYKFDAEIEIEYLRK